MVRSKQIVGEAPADLIVVARVAGAYGIKGWVKLIPESKPSSSVLLHTRKWWIGTAPNESTALDVVQVRSQGSAVVAQLGGVTVREQAEALRSRSILISRLDFPAPTENEYYWVDLIGCEVENASGVALGEVENLVEHGAHSILVVRPKHLSQAQESDQILIPFVAQYLLNVDLPAKKIRVDWGLDY